MRCLSLLLCLFSLNTLYSQSLFDNAIECIKRYEGLHNEAHHPYVGYGHKLLPGESYPANLSEVQADSLLRADILKRCRLFRRYGKDSLLLSVLSYNVGTTRVNQSNLLKKLKNGNRDIYIDYISFRLINGKVSMVLERRRKEEYDLLFNQ